MSQEPPKFVSTKKLLIASLMEKEHMEESILGSADEGKTPEFKSPPMSTCDTSLPSSPGPSSSPSDAEASEDVFLPSISISITQETGNFLRTSVKSADMPLPPSLKGMREMLLSSEIADESYNIFFPSWTFTMYMLVKGDDQKEVVESVETDEHLVELLNRERASSNTVSIKLEQCKNIKYSRFHPGNSQSLSPPQFGSIMFSDQKGSSRGQVGRGKFGKRKGCKKSHSSDDPIVPFGSLKSLAQNSPRNANGKSSSASGSVFYGHYQIDPRYRTWGDSDCMRGLVESQAQSTHGYDLHAYGAGMHYHLAPVVLPSHPVYYHGMGYWAFPSISHPQHHGAALYLNCAPWMAPSANQQCF